MDLQKWYKEKRCIVGDGIVLHPITEADVDDIFANFTKPVTKYMYPAAPKDKSETEAFVYGAVRGWQCGIETVFIIRDKEGGFIGCVGLHGILCGHPEIGIWTSEKVRGHGYGKQAVELAVKFGREMLKPDYFVYPVDHRNGPSRRIPLSMNGKAMREFTYENKSGDTLEMIEYWID